MVLAVLLIEQHRLGEDWQRRVNGRAPWIDADQPGAFRDRMVVDEHELVVLALLIGEQQLMVADLDALRT